MAFRRTLLFLIFFSVLVFEPVKGQKFKLDSNYVEETPELFSLRFYFSKKYTDLIQKTADGNTYRFQPNSGNNLGIGFTYQKLTLNLAMPVGFLNPDRQQDWPLYLDLQAHLYPKNMIIDVFGQFYNGYSIPSDFLSNSDSPYLREDIKLRKLGLNFNYLFNGEQLSLMAAFNQSFIQKRSAFSPFVGFEVYGGSIKGDSLLLPTFENQRESNFSSNRSFQVGPNAGLAGTVVFGGGFFLTGVFSGNLSLAYAQWNGSSDLDQWGIVPTYLLRGFFGYNSRKFSINANYVLKNNQMVRLDNFDLSKETGNYRINFIYKFQPGEGFKRGFSKINPLRLIKKD